MIAAVLAHMLRRDSPIAGALIPIAMTVIIFMALVPTISSLFGVFGELTAQLGSGSAYVLIVVKVIGIAYIAEFGSQICADAQEAALAQTVELAGRVAIMAVSAPVILALIRQTAAMLT